jgi:tripartite-type tricarboxylate transporter receptor subunit TctC
LEMKKKTLAGLLGVALLAVTVISGCGSPSSSTAAKKEDLKYPVKPIDYIVPYAPGGGTDLVARAVAGYIAKEWGHPVNVINKPGAGGATGVQEALKQAKNDGYTVLATNVSSASALIGGSVSLPFKLEDHLFISQVVEDPLVFVVKDDAPWKDLKEFSEWVKKNPDQLTYTTSGPTAIATFGVAEWMDAIGADFSKARMIVTKGAADSIPKVAGGHVVLSVQALGESSTLVKAGKVKMIAVQAKKRSQYFPDVPTVEEAGIKMTSKWWTGVAAPVGTPKEIVKKWEDALANMSKDPSFLEKLKQISAESAYLNSADFTKAVKIETDKFTDVAIKKDLRK